MSTPQDRGSPPLRSSDHDPAGTPQRLTALGDLAWPDVGARSPVLLVPVGSVEQHGPHLPLRTDTVIASAIAARVAERLGPSYVVGPAVEYGASGEHQDFPGTVSIGHEALSLLLVELARSATTWASAVVFVNGHGGNLAALTAAVGRLRAEGRRVGWTSCAQPGCDAHAGESETSLLLALAPASVGPSRVRGETAPVASLMAELRSGGVRAVSPTGVLGDPTVASLARGEQLLAAVTDRVCGEVSRLAVDERGRLR